MKPDTIEKVEKQVLNIFPDYCFKCWDMLTYGNTKTYTDKEFSKERNPLCDKCKEENK